MYDFLRDNWIIYNRFW